MPRLVSQAPPRTRSTRNLAGSVEPTPGTRTTLPKSSKLVEKTPANAARRGQSTKETGLSNAIENRAYVELPVFKAPALKRQATVNASDAEREPIKALLMTDPTPGNPNNRRVTTSSAASATYSFTHVFPPETSQTELFKEAALPLIKDLLNGDNGLIFAYGVTNSGKTFTVQGGRQKGEAGLLPRTLDVIFNSIQGLECNAPIRPTRLSSIEHDPNASDIPVLETPDSLDISIDTSNGVLAGLIDDQPGEGEVIDESKVGVDDDYEYSVWVSYAEIYNEKIFDLLGDGDLDAQTAGGGTRPQTATLVRPASAAALCRSTTFTTTTTTARLSAVSRTFSLTNNLAALASLSSSTSSPVISRKALSLRSDASSPRGGKYVVGLREVRVRSSEDAKRILKMGQINRRVFGTLANKWSSRSHAVFSVRVIRLRKGANFQEDPSAVRVSRLSIVDLAGSERYKNTQNTGERLKEAGNINKSLMVLGQCLEVMRNNQRRLTNRHAEVDANGRKTPNGPGRPDKAMVPFWYSKLTELFQDFFEGDGKAAMIVNVNPHNTGFDENSHVMKFAALAREVTTTVVQNKPHATLQPTVPKAVEKPKLPPARRTVSLVTGPRESGDTETKTLWEVAEEDEDEPGEASDDLVDRLFEIIEELKEKLYETEFKYAMAEVDIRQEVAQEFEERIRDMEARFADRRMNDKAELEDLMDKKIDLWHQAGYLGGPSGNINQETIPEENEDVESTLDDEGTASQNGHPSPSPVVHSKPELDRDEQRTTSGGSNSREDDDIPVQTDSQLGERVGRSVDKDDIQPHDRQRASGGKTSDTKTSKNSAKNLNRTKLPPPLPKYDVSMDEIPVVPAKRPIKRITDPDQQLEDAEGNPSDDDPWTSGSEMPVAKKKKRHLGKKTAITEDEILQVAQRVEAEEGAKGKRTVRRMGS
ncbi:hypothetical protein FRB99_000700 [Tulasnella sp. 403]|nr:hypothetical protein FRB99_000700 [Tulasnella sp. 403]